jgi:hypothetical protein
MMGELWLHRRRCSDVPSVQGSIAPGMVLQHRGWPHRVGDDAQGRRCVDG